MMSMALQHDGAPAHYSRLVASSKSKITRTMDRPRWSRSVATKITRPFRFAFLSVEADEKQSIQRKINTRVELVARIMNSAAVLKQDRHEDFRRATPTFVNTVEKCI
jgi:hypothetical protein